MIKCRCGRTTDPGERTYNIPIQKRPVQYRHSADGPIVAEGTEIVREVRLCVFCAQEVEDQKLTAPVIGEPVTRIISQPQPKVTQ